MSGPIQSWQDKVAHALTFAKPLRYKTVFSFNVRNITHLEFSDRNKHLYLANCTSSKRTKCVPVF